MAKNWCADVAKNWFPVFRKTGSLQTLSKPMRDSPRDAWVSMNITNNIMEITKNVGQLTHEVGRGL